MWQEKDIRFFSSLANKSGAFSWMAKKTEDMFENRRDLLRISGIILCIPPAIASLIAALVTDNSTVMMIIMLICSIIEIIGTTLNNIDQLLGYGEEIKIYRRIMESNSEIYWEIYNTLQYVNTGGDVDIDMFRKIIDVREKENIKKHREFPQKIIDEYYRVFGENAIEYNVLFNEKIDPMILVNMIPNEPEIVPPLGDDAIILSKKQQYELDKYLNNFNINN